MNNFFERVADGLANNGYAIVDDFLKLEEVDQILNLGMFKDYFEDFKKAGVGNRQLKQINEAVRGDYIHWLEKTSAPEPIRRYFQRLEDLYHYLNQSLFLSIKDAEIHLTIYPPGTFYKRHLDRFKKDDRRILSVICYLNKGWQESDGGKLRLYLPDSSLDITPEAGRLVCFRSDQLEHEVLSATRERLSLTGWLLNQLIDVS